MVKAAKTARPWLEIWAIGLDDNPAGVAAKKKLAITGPATEAGTLNVYIGFYRVQIAVAAADTADTVAARLAAAINLLTTCPMTRR
ncbi:hypothetical protein [Methylogaea oryzae]|uniref:hypothetical protein n=1 Tax=Methylogaea oryzae TaxID=1295382 RepID=UPI0006D27F77|nr:hypothetical protein [Methylogaea oryzae]